MAIKPDEWPKAALLILGIVAALGFSGYTLWTLRRPAPAAVEAPARAEPGTALRAPTAAGTPEGPAGLPGSYSQATQVDLGAEEDYPIPPPTRDPFRPPPGAPLPAGRKTPAAPSPRAPSPSVVLGSPLPGSQAAPGVPVPGPPAAERAPRPVVAVKGVVASRPAIAVLAVDGSTVFRQPGELVAEGIRLRRVTDAGVLLRIDGQEVFLRVGHSTEPRGRSGRDSEGLLQVAGSFLR